VSDDVMVVGVGMTRCEQTDATLEDLGQFAVKAAMRDAGLERGDIEAAICGSFGGHPGLGVRLFRDLGMLGDSMAVVNVENGCGGGGTAFREAYAWVKAGLAEVVIAVGVEKMTHGLIDVGPVDYTWRSGFSTPVMAAHMARTHMAKYGTTVEQFAKVAVKNRHNGSLNPNAHLRKAITMDTVLSDRVLADPITRSMSCPTTDAGAAAILTSSAFAKRIGARAVKVLGSGMVSGRTGTRADSDDIQDFGSGAARKAYEAAGLGPEDIDVAEVHEPFAPFEIFCYEWMGFCEPGEGGRYIDEGRAAINGSGVAVNPSGGLMARGHPLGASGMAQIHEAVTQLRGEAGDRQVEKARIALCHNAGGSTPQTMPNAAIVNILAAADRSA
jgi:acetyl-CoA acetyltransferase